MFTEVMVTDQGRAIDVTQHKGGDPEYKQTYLPVLTSGLANNPFAIKMLIHDTWGFYKDGKNKDLEDMDIHSICILR